MWSATPPIGIFQSNHHNPTHTMTSTDVHTCQETETRMLAAMTRLVNHFMEQHNNGNTNMIQRVCTVSEFKEQLTRGRQVSIEHMKFMREKYPAQTNSYNLYRYASCVYSHIFNKNKSKYESILAKYKALANLTMDECLFDEKPMKIETEKGNAIICNEEAIVLYCNAMKNEIQNMELCGQKAILYRFWD